LTATKIGGKWENHEGIPVISANNIKNGLFVELDSVKRINSELFEKWMPIKLERGDVLLVSEGATFGELLYLGESLKAALGQRLFAIRCNNDYDSRYLYYYLKSKKGQQELRARTTGTSVLGIRQSELRQIVVPDIRIEEQKEIADILGSVDNKILLNRQMNNILEATAGAIFKRWFVDFEFPNEEGKPYKSSGGEMVYNEDLSKDIPKGWTVTKLGEVVRFLRGVSYKSEDLEESEKALVSLKSIARGGGFNAEGLKSYTGEYREEQVLKSGDIVVAHTDLTQKAEVLGKPALIRRVRNFKTLIASMDLGIIRPNDGKSNSYVYLLLKSESFQNHIVGYANGTTVLHLSNKGVKEYLFAVPPWELTSKFGKVVDDLFKKIEQNSLESETLIQLREVLLPKLMSGKIRVSVPNESTGAH